MRRRHLPTVCGVTLKRRATAELVEPFGAGENHACPLDQGVGQGGRPGNSVELILLLVGEREWYQWASEWHGSLPCLKPAAYDTHFRDCTLVRVWRKTQQVVDSTGCIADFKWRRSSGCRILWSGFPRIGPFREYLRDIDIMREVHRSQFRLGQVPIEKIWLNPKSRDDIPAVLKGLQHIWCDEEFRERLFALLDEHILPEADRTVGRPGMELWQILVLGVLKQGLGCDFDRLHELTNHHDTIRAFLGHRRLR